MTPLPTSTTTFDPASGWHLDANTISPDLQSQPGT